MNGGDRRAYEKPRTRTTCVATDVAGAIELDVRNEPIAFTKSDGFLPDGDSFRQFSVKFSPRKLLRVNQSSINYIQRQSTNCTGIRNEEDIRDICDPRYRTMGTGISTTSVKRSRGSNPGMDGIIGLQKSEKMKNQIPRPVPGHLGQQNVDIRES